MGSNRGATELNNAGIIRKLSDDTLAKQQQGIQHLLGVTSDSSFITLTSSQQIQTIADHSPFTKGQPLKRGEIRNVYRTNYSDVSVAIDSANLGVSIAATSYSGAMCLAGLLTSYTGVGGIVAVTQCPMFALGTLFTANTVASLMGNKERNRTTTEFSTLLGTKSIGENASFTFLSSSDFNPELHLPELKLRLSILGSANDVKVDAPGSKTETEEQLSNHIKEKLPKSGFFANDEDFKNFLETYISHQGALQTELIKSFLESRRVRALDQERLAKEKAAFYQSLHGVISTILGKSMRPREARLFSGLVGAGFQYLTTTAMGPLGWGAITLNIVNSLIQSDEPDFTSMVLEAIAELRKQIEVILDRVNSIYYTQLDILNRLNDVLEEIAQFRRITAAMLERLSRDTSRIYKAISEDLRQRYYDAVQVNTIELRQVLRPSYLPSPEQNFESLKKLRNLTIELDNRHFTGFSARWFSGIDLHETLTVDGRYDHAISIYDTIGLASAMAGYDIVSDGGQCTTPIIHPIEFYAACNNIVIGV